jgi:hypothetical protein
VSKHSFQSATHHQGIVIATTMFEVLGANVASFSGLENMDVVATKKAFHIARR